MTTDRSNTNPRSAPTHSPTPDSNLDTSSSPKSLPNAIGWFPVLCAWLRANRTRVRLVFVLYALVLVTLTHWPNLAVAKPFEIRLDLFIHLGVFGGWNLLLISAGWFGLVGTRSNISRATAAALIYATIDELTQGIPIVHRTVDPMDLLANSTGIVIIGTIYFILTRRYPHQTQG